MTSKTGRTAKVMIVGASWHMTSGISHYTYRLSGALAERHQVSVLLMRRLIPRRLYPGAARVGADLTEATYPEQVPVYDGVDWYWGPSMHGALDFIDRQRPEVVILQWWTGAVLHSYLRIAAYAARRGAQVIVEWHEAQDLGEARLPGTRRYVGSLLPRLLSRAAAHVVHSNFDRDTIASAYTLGRAPVRVIKHGPYDHLARRSIATVNPQADQAPMRLLYLGVVRPFKGVEDLVEAFSGLDRTDAERFRLAIIGETWEDWAAPAQAIARSPHADLIERVDRYVTDAELTAYFEEADAVILPYHRSSASGPLHIAMSAGLPVVVTAVGGLVEAVSEYPGGLLVPPRDPVALRRALVGLLGLRGRRYADPHSWESVANQFATLIDQVLSSRGIAPRQVTGLSTGAVA